MSQAKWLCTGVAFWALGCGADVAHNDAPNSSSRLPSERVSAGLRYVPVRENHAEQYSLSRAKSLFAEPRADDAHNGHDLATLSDEELAQRMAGLTMIDGWIYRVEPEPQTVQAVRAHIGEAIRGKRPSKHARAEQGTGLLREAVIIDDGVDPKLVADPTAYPYSAITLLLEQGLPEGVSNGATAVMIGRATLLTAAHCFWDGANFREFNLSPGANAQNPVPFGEYGCYGVIIAASTGWPTDDYAVVDFQSAMYGCNDAPGDASGWMGSNPVSDAALQNAPLQLFGYPTDAQDWPQLWGMSGRAVTPIGDTVLSWTMDQSEGDSGAPVYMFDANGYPDVVGIVSRGDTDFGRVENVGPRVTNAMIANIRAWSSEY